MFKKVIFVIMIAVLLAAPINSGIFTGLGSGEGSTAAAAENNQTELLQTRKEVVKAIRTGLLNRKAKIEIDFTDAVRKKLSDVNELMNEVFAYDIASNAKDADYLEYSVLEWAVQLQWIPGQSATLTLSPVYKCTLKEEKALDKKVSDVLEALKLEKATDYKKVKAIHDYIIKRVSYDLSLENVSAYDALIHKSAVCEGYAMAAYLMFTKAGLDCRIISGKADGAAHAWNIVKVKGKWYNIDLTWDDPVTSNGKPMLTYDYFLKSTKDFKNHIRDAAYRTDEFVKAHPIAKSSYTT